MFSFIWDMTGWNQADIKIATGKPNKSTPFWLHLEQIRLPWWTQYHAKQAIETSLHPIISGEMILDNIINWLLQAWYCVRRAKGAKFVQSANKIPVFFFLFSRSDLIIQLISARHVSNERKQTSDQIYYLLFLSRGYT